MDKLIYTPNGGAYTEDSAGALGVRQPDKDKPKPPAGQAYDRAGNLGSAGNGNNSGNNSGAPGTNPGQVGNAFYPEYLGGLFPEYKPIDFQPINVPDYQMFDPQQYAEQYGAFNRGEFFKNFSASQELGLGQLQTELKGLQQFVPYSAALKREQTAVDNLFNQAQRTQQLDSTMPGMREALAAQTGRANTYAGGRLGSGIEDAGLEYGIRSRAADQSASRGFGDNSLVGRKVSDIMSAEKRFEIAQYGENLLGVNAQTRNAVEMAPTAYSNAGEQINVMPEVGAGRAAQAYGQALNQSTMIDPSTALNSAINQSQFSTNLNLDVSKTNQTLGIDVDKFNTSNQLGLDLSEFNYTQGFAGAVAGANQANANQIREDAIREQVTQIFNDSRQDAQDAGSISDILGAVGSIAGFFSSISGGSTNETPQQTAQAAQAAVNSSPTQTVAPSPTTPSSSSSGIGTATSNISNNSITTSVDNVPAGYTPIASAANGGVISIPTSAKAIRTADGYNLSTDYRDLAEFLGIN